MTRGLSPFHAVDSVAALDMRIVRPQTEGTGSVQAQHEHCVDELLRRWMSSSQHADAARVLGEALSVVWGVARLTLGEVTLAAIFHRVFANANRKFPEVVELRLEPRQERFRELATRAGPAAPSATLPAAVRGLLVELLSVLGNLTAEISPPRFTLSSRASAGPCKSPRRKTTRRPPHDNPVRCSLPCHRGA